MSSLQQISILGSDAGLRLDIKPYLIPEKAFSTLENAYVWRERVIKKQGFEFLGRLRRNFNNLLLGNSGAASPWVFNIWTTLVPPIVPEATAEIEAGSVRINIDPSAVTGAINTYSRAANCVVVSAAHGLSTNDIIEISGVNVKPGTGDNLINGGPYTITVLSPNTFALNVDSTQWGQFLAPGGTWTKQNTLAEILIDQGDGTLATNPVSATVGTVNYLTGDVTITNGSLSQPTIISFNYFPGLPVMGIWQQELAGINDEITIFFDTKYAYDYTGTGFNEFLPGTEWDGTDSDFFWTANYRGMTADVRLFFVTNFFNSATVPMRYTDGITWSAFTPQVSNVPATLVLQARIIIPYYGRLLLLNTWEGTSLGGGENFFNRCRFSQIGNPIEPYNFANGEGAFAQDIFGKGGFIDAPTNEQIISAAFFKNTLIVYFERSVWQLRYVGEYGLPFLWERVSSDFGSESTFSTVLFDDSVLGFGDRAIIQCNSVQAGRIDEVIPDVVFNVLNDQNGPKRVIGVRDFQRELVFWTYPDATTLAEGQYYPNKVLVFNYRNNTWARFDDNVTFFGTMQPTGATTWDSTEIFWDDENVTWDSFNQQSRFPRIVAGNQQGFVGFYGYVLPDETSLTISGIDLVSLPNQITVTNHNLQTAEIFRITGTEFIGADPGLNDNFYKVLYVDVNTIALQIWNGTSFVNAQLTPGGTYVGNGKLTVYPRPNIVTKDFNPYMNQGNNTKLSYIDFLMDCTANGAVSVQIFANASPSVQANLILGNFKFSTTSTLPFYEPNSDYAWFRFFVDAKGNSLELL